MNLLFDIAGNDWTSFGRKRSKEGPVAFRFSEFPDVAERMKSNVQRDFIDPYLRKKNP